MVSKVSILTRTYRVSTLRGILSVSAAVPDKTKRLHRYSSRSFIGERASCIKPATGPTPGDGGPLSFGLGHTSYQIWKVQSGQPFNVFVLDLLFFFTGFLFC